MSHPNDFHLTDAEDTILVEITCRSIPITPEMRFRRRNSPSPDPDVAPRPEQPPHDPPPEDTTRPQ
jgi:hypothetical protein